MQRLFILTKLICLLFFLALAIWFGVYLKKWFNSAELQPQLISNTKSSVAYMIDDDSIRLEPSTFANQEIRIITNLIFSKYFQDYELRHQYTIKITGLDEQGITNFERVVNHISRMKPKVLNENNEYIAPKFIMKNDIEYQGTTGQAIYLNDNELTSEIIQIEVVSKPSQSIGLIVRARGLEILDEPTRHNRWRTISEESKITVLRPHIYDRALVPLKEKLRAMSQSWHRLPVVESDQKPVNTVRLYQANESWLDIYPAIDELISIEHVLINDNLNASFVIVKEGPISINVVGKPKKPITWQWFGYSGEQRSGSLPTAQPDLNLTLTPGLIVINSETPVYLQPVTSQNTIAEIEHMRLYPLENGAITFENIAQGNNSNNLMRIDLRFGMHEFDNTELKIEALDITGRIIMSESFFPVNELDEFQRIIDKSTQRIRITKRQSQVFKLAENISTIRITGNPSALVNVYTRNEKMPAVSKLPQEKYSWKRHEFSVATWHYLKPVEHNQMVSEGDIRTLRFFNRPLDVPSEHQSYKSIMVEGRPALEGFIELTHTQQKATTKYQDIFYKIASNPQNKYSLIADKSRSNNPEYLALYYTRPITDIETIIIKSNGVAFSHQLYGYSGRIMLPIGAQNKLSLDISGNNSTEWYVREWKEKRNSKMYLKRFFFKLKDSISLSLSSYPETKLSINSMTDRGQSEVNLEVTISPSLSKTMVDKYTHRKRRLQIAPDDTRTAFLVGHKFNEYNFYGPAILSFYDDLDNSKISLRITNLGDAPVWVAFSQLTPNTVHKLDWDRNAIQ